MALSRWFNGAAADKDLPRDDHQRPMELSEGGRRLFLQGSCSPPSKKNQQQMNKKTPKSPGVYFGGDGAAGGRQPLILSDKMKEANNISE